MSFLGGIVKSVINPVSLAQLALGPAGWASLAVRTIGMAIGKEVIQQLGQKLGLPQSMISLAQTAFSATAGGGKLDLASATGQAAPASLGAAVKMVASQFNLSPAQEGGIARSANSAVSQMVRAMMDEAKADAEKAATSASTSTGGSTEGKGSYLQAMAEALGGVLDNKMNEIEGLSTQISTQNASNQKFTASIGAKDASFKTGSALQDNANKMGTLTSKLSAATQELSIMQNAVSNALKTIGEAQSGMARKG